MKRTRKLGEKPGVSVISGVDPPRKFWHVQGTLGTAAQAGVPRSGLTTLGRPRARREQSGRPCDYCATPADDQRGLLWARVASTPRAVSAFLQTDRESTPASLPPAPPVRRDVADRRR